ncbi:MAG: hypothetical protein ACTHMQ_04250 [Protaetiibacter sp.]
MDRRTEVVSGGRMFIADVEYVAVRPDLRFPVKVDATTTGRDDDPYSLWLTAVWEPSASKYEVTSLRIDKRLQPITSAGLRTIAVQELFRSAAAIMVRSADDSEAISIPPLATLTRITEDDEELKQLWAARIYVIARAQDRPPLEAVASAFGISQSTATRLVRKAKDAGLIDE